MTEQEMKAIFAKTDAALASLAAAQERSKAEFDDRMKSLAAAQERTEVQLAQTEVLVKSLAASQAQSDARLDRVSDKLDAVGLRLDAVGLKLNAVAEMLGGVANSNGEVTEEFFFNSLKRDPNIGAIHFDQVKSNVVFKEDGVKKAELDILMLNGQCAAVIEVKHRPQKKDVEQLLKTVSYYKTTLPKDKQGKKYKIYGGIAGFSVPRSIVNLAKDNGLFVLKQAGLVVTSQTEGMTAF